jgi:hypothetical protein
MKLPTNLIGLIAAFFYHYGICAAVGPGLETKERKRYLPVYVSPPLLWPADVADLRLADPFFAGDSGEPGDAQHRAGHSGVEDPV